MRTYLVTGGSGFIGSALCRQLARQPATRVINVDNLSYAGSHGATEDLQDRTNYRFVRASVVDEARMAALLRSERVDAVVHLAAQTHVDRSIADPAAFLTANVVGTHNLLLAALTYWRELPVNRRDGFRFHHVSTDEVFGSIEPGGAPFSETSAYRPSSPYSASKASADHFVRAFHRTYGLPVTVSNCSNNYGPFQYPEKLVPVVIANALRGLPIPVYGDGQQIRDWLFVDDHVEAIAKIVDFGRPGETYNVGGGTELANLEIIEMICARLDEQRPRRGGRHSDRIEFVADRPGHDRRYAVDIGKIGAELGWRPATGIAEGVERTVAWYLDNAWWWEPLLFQPAARADGRVAAGAA